MKKKEFLTYEFFIVYIKINIITMIPTVYNPIFSKYFVKNNIMKWTNIINNIGKNAINDLLTTISSSSSACCCCDDDFKSITLS